MTAPTAEWQAARIKCGGRCVESLAAARGRWQALADHLTHRRPFDCQPWCVHLHAGRYALTMTDVDAGVVRDYDLTVLRKAFGDEKNPDRALQIVAEFTALAAQPL